MGTGFSWNFNTSRFSPSQCLVFISAHSNHLFQINSVRSGLVYFGLGGLVFWLVTKLYVYYGGFILKATDWNLHTLDC